MGVVSFMSEGLHPLCPFDKRLSGPRACLDALEKNALPLPRIRGLPVLSLVIVPTELKS